jgi:hypothetical protein
MIDLLVLGLGTALAGWILVIQLPGWIIKDFTLLLDAGYFIGTMWLSMQIGGQQLALAAIIAGVLFSALLHFSKLFVRR